MHKQNKKPFSLQLHTLEGKVKRSQTNEGKRLEQKQRAYKGDLLREMCVMSLQFIMDSNELNFAI